jgi:hypothetical protein
MRTKTPILHPLPLTHESADMFYTRLLSFLDMNESGSVYYHNKSDFLFRITQLQTDERLKDKYLKGNKIVLLDAESLNLEDPESWDTQITKLTAKDKTLICISGIDGFLKRGDSWFFHYLMKKEIECPEFVFVLVFNIDFLNPLYLDTFAKTTTWIRRTIRFPLHSFYDTLSYLLHQSIVWKMQIDEKAILEIAENTAGGYFLLPKEALRFKRDNPDADIDKIIHHREMDLRINLIYDQLLPSEQAVLQKIITSIPITDKVELHSLKFLLETGWINYINGKYSITIPLLSEYIRKFPSTISLKLTATGRVLLNNVPVDSNFSVAEEKLLKLLIINKNSVITRDQIADSVFDNTNDWNNWAIDKLISRLRNKLKLLDVSPLIIKTIYRKGIMISLS